MSNRKTGEAAFTKDLQKTLKLYLSGKHRPTLEDLRKKLGVKSRNAVHARLLRLKEIGKLKMSEEKRGRGYLYEAV